MAYEHNSGVQNHRSPLRLCLFCSGAAMLGGFVGGLAVSGSEGALSSSWDIEDIDFCLFCGGCGIIAGMVAGSLASLIATGLQPGRPWSWIRTAFSFGVVGGAIIALVIMNQMAEALGALGHSSLHYRESPARAVQFRARVEIGTGGPQP